MRIIPAIDIIDGKCVRLAQGDFKKVKMYREDPVEVAKEFEDADLEYLHLVDLDGAKQGNVVNWDVIEDIQAKTTLKVDFGGGIKKTEEVDRLLDLGINQINVGSIAVVEPTLFSEWLWKYGPENFILSSDVRDENILINGWTAATEINLFDLVSRFVKDGLEFVCCTDVKTDGMLEGPNFILYRKLRSHFPNIKIIASGGISSVSDLEELQYIHVDGAIIGKAIYEGKIKLPELRNLI
jgi:phosphoribosylformimino-5-aminoimidazole carboxamide ribotide isomerase